MTLLSYIDHLQKQNLDDLAFYPLTAFKAALTEGRIILCEDNNEPAGYLWHGPARAGFDIVIYQACVDYDSRKRTLGWAMVASLIAIGQRAGSNGIRLRCASSSESNLFWQAIGFYCTKVTRGGAKRSRDINHWRTDVAAPLFTVDSVDPSTTPIDLRPYRKMIREGKTLRNRWAR
jgi:hypothetical protein